MGDADWQPGWIRLVKNSNIERRNWCSRVTFGGEHSDVFQALCCQIHCSADNEDIRNGANSANLNMQSHFDC